MQCRSRILRSTLILVIFSTLSAGRLFAQDDTSASVPDDPTTAMTLEKGDPITDTDPPNNEQVAGDASYTQPDSPQTPDTPETGGNYEGPVGVTGIFNGNITTGCSYDPLTHSAHRAIDDIVVPGSLGKYPLKMTRYYNSRQQYYGSGHIGLSPGWAHEYSWLVWGAGTKVVSPHGGVSDFYCGPPVGVSEGWDDGVQASHYGGTGVWRLADGGSVHFTGSKVTSIDDPYGFTTTIDYDGSGLLAQVTEPGGRYLKFIFDPNVTDPDGSRLLTRVEAHALGNATVTDWVNYSYTSTSPGVQGRNKMMLTRVDYSDGTYATYQYANDNVSENQSTHKMYPLLQRCDDVRYNGPMRTIRYEYQAAGAHGAIVNEKYPGVGAASAIAPGVAVITGGTFTETRGDGPTRSFTYSQSGSACLHNPEACGPCDNVGTNGPDQQAMLLSYNDFQGHSTQLGYDPNWYVNSVTNARGYTTTYDRGLPPSQGSIGEIKKITHPDNTCIQYIYQNEPGQLGGHYVMTIIDERGNKTVHTRDSRHRIVRTDYKDANDTVLASENFSYCDQADSQCNNAFGQLKRHQLKNGSYVHYQYDSRGRLTAKWNPTSNPTAVAGDPKTTYTYWNNSVWADRVYTMTLPTNGSNKQAYEHYEYDRNASSNACAGRGLVTKMVHGDGTYESFGYTQYGNKLWEENEKRQRTSYVYDNYNRVLTVTKPLIGAETFNYLKAGTTSSYLHTTDSVYTHTSRTGIVTNNLYDPNWRKSSTTTAGAMTQFAYDEMGNLTDVTDPRNKVTHNGYDNRDRKTSTTEAYGITGLAATTVWHYNPVGSVFRIDHPDNSQDQETKAYDALNRMISHTAPRQVLGGGQVYLTTRFDYNPSGTVSQVTDPMGHHTSFIYDASDRKTQMTYHDGSHQSWIYDDAGNLTSRTTVNSKTQSFTYDIRNRKVTMSWSNQLDWANFGYDDASRLTSANNANSSTTRIYDAAGRLTQDQQTVTGFTAKNVNYGYDADGKVNHLSVDGASYDYTFTYDSMGRFEKIFDSGNLSSPLFQYAYDAASNETDRYSYFNNNTIDQVYNRDSLNRISSRLLKKNGQSPAFSSEAYTYDKMNRMTDVARGSAGDHFDYYWTGELKTASYGGQPHMPYTEGQDPDLDNNGDVDPNAGYQPPKGAEAEPTPPPDDYSDPAVGGYVPSDSPTGRSVAYYLDKAGNRQQVTDSVNGSPSYTRNNINQYTAITGVVGSTITNGNEHEVNSYKTPTDTHAVTYTYINDEHLTTAFDGTNTYSLLYDALGRCVKRSLKGLTTYYIYDGEKPVVEYGPSSAIAKNVYGKGIDEILMRTDSTVNSGNPIYYGQDHEGSVTHLLNGTGNVIESYLYDAFGAPTIYNGGGAQIDHTAWNNRFLFTGREYATTYQKTYVANFGFYEYRARAYHPTLGRFMSEDPKLFDGGDYNLFRYCHNDPLDLADPMGTETNWAGAGPQMPGNHNAEVMEIDSAYNFIMGLMQRQFSSAISAGMVGYNAWSGLSHAVSIAGQLMGKSVAKPNSLPKGNPKDANAPAKLEIQRKENRGPNSIFHLQLETEKGRWLREDGSSAEENVTVTSVTGNLSIKDFQNTNGQFVSLRKGDLADRVGLLRTPSAGAYGDILKRQVYDAVIYQGQMYPFHAEFIQSSHVESGAVFNSLIPVGP